jgi:hypothetical protein
MPQGLLRRRLTSPRTPVINPANPVAPASGINATDDPMRPPVAWPPTPKVSPGEPVQVNAYVPGAPAVTVNAALQLLTVMSSATGSIVTALVADSGAAPRQPTRCRGDPALST